MLLCGRKCSQSINFCEPAGFPGIYIYSIRKKKEKKKETFPSFNNVIAQIFVFFSTFKSVISMVLALKLNFFCYFKEFLTPMSAVYNYIFILFIT